MTRLGTITLGVAIAALAVLARPTVGADPSEHGSHGAAAGTQMGEVSFATSCAPAVQSRFNQAVWVLHSFWYEEAVKMFTAISQDDPGCAMAYWGLAMSKWYPLWFPPSPAMLQSGSEAVAKGLAVPPKTERERGYLEAIGAFYRGSDKLDHRTRALAYEKAMGELHARYPDDREAAVFYALALDATWPPTDKSYANLKQAAAILEPIWVEQPDHPGVIHYLIHSYDTPALAESGLKAARRYAAIAPAVPHAQHMPSHIFTRLGLWQESIESNLIGNRVAAAYAAETFGPGGYDQETVHTLDYLAYAYLQTAQDQSAKRVVDLIAAMKKGQSANLPIAYALAAIPARYALERRQWSEAASLKPVTPEFPWDRFPWAAAMTAYARALGAAQTGDVAGAQAELAILQGYKDKLAEAKNDYWANQVEVQRLGAAAMLAQAQGDGAQALALSQAATDLEASMDKHPATPGMVLPARELRADLLLARNDAAGALAEYQGVLRTDPNRFRSVLGRARAAKAAGDTTTAKEAYQYLMVLCIDADTMRPELAEAKSFLTQ
jgi:hypothetical protein